MRLPAPLLLLIGLIALLPGIETRARSPAGTEAKYTKLTDVPESERQELDAFGRQLEADLVAKDIPKAVAAFDMPGLIDQILTGFNIPDSKRQEMQSGMETKFRSRLESIFTNWSECFPKYKHLVLHDGRIRLRFRLVYEDHDSANFMDLHVVRGPGGRLGIVDMFYHTMGSGFAEQIQQTLLPALVKLDPGALSRGMGGSSNTDPRELTGFIEMYKLFRGNDFKGTIDAYHQLSPQMRSQLPPTLLNLAALKQVVNVELYKAAVLLEASRAQSPAVFEYMLLEVYLGQGNHAKAVECLDAFMAAVEEDAVLLAMKGVLQLKSGAVESARGTILKALALEPDSFSVHVRAMNVLLAAKDYKSLADSLRFLEKHSTHRFKGGLTDPSWADFLKSPESLPWR